MPVNLILSLTVTTPSSLFVCLPFIEYLPSGHYRTPLQTKELRMKEYKSKGPPRQKVEEKWRGVAISMDLVSGQFFYVKEGFNKYFLLHHLFPFPSSTLTIYPLAKTKF